MHNNQFPQMKQSLLILQADRRPQRKSIEEQGDNSQELLVPRSPVRREISDGIDDFSSVADSQPNEVLGDARRHEDIIRNNQEHDDTEQPELDEASHRKFRSTFTASGLSEARVAKPERDAQRRVLESERMKPLRRPTSALPKEAMSSARHAPGDSSTRDDTVVVPETGRMNMAEDLFADSLEEPDNTDLLFEQITAITDATQAWVPTSEDGQTHNPYMEALNEDIQKLVKTLWQNEAIDAQRPSLRNLTFEEFRRMAIPVLATIPTCYLREIINNNLAHAHLGERKADICAMYRLYNQGFVLENIAVVYMISLADREGLGPTIAEWVHIKHAITDYMDYTSSDPRKVELAIKIDAQGHPRHDKEKNVHGWRRYLPPHTDKDKDGALRSMPTAVRYANSVPPKVKLERMSEFLAAVDQRKSHATSQDEPLTLNYVGYSYKVVERWKSHESNPTNPFMGAMLSIAQVLFPSRAFKLRKYVVVPLAGEEEAAMAEVLVAALANSYYQTGFGFNIAGAGESNDSFEKFTLQQKRITWRWIANHSPRLSNIQQQLRLLQTKLADEASIIRVTQEQTAQVREETVSMRDELQRLEKTVVTLKLREARLVLQRKKREFANVAFEIAKLKAEEQLLTEMSERRKRVMALMEQAINAPMAPSSE